MYSPVADGISWAEIDLDALAFNLNQVRALVGESKKILAVIKAHAYGHGAIPVARALELRSVDFLGVAYAEEGAQLRKAGIRRPILVLAGIFPDQVASIFEYNLTPVIYDLDIMRFLEAEGKQRRQSVPVHVKIDTGMSRLGISVKEVERSVNYWRTLKYARVEGVLSHFSSAHLKDEESEAFTRKQADDFRSVVADLQGCLGSALVVHMSSSSSIIRGLIPECSMARAGLLLYGADPAKGWGPAISLKPVMTMKTRILQVKTVPTGSPVSYGRTFCTRCDSVIATIGIGYGDGYCHSLSNRGSVLVHGRRVPVVGAVCMDLTMVDVTGIPEVRPGDEVVLFGCQGTAMLPVEEVASQAGTIAYTVLCGISGRVPRRYLGEGSSIE